MTPSGKLLNQFGGHLGFPTGIVKGLDNNLWFTEHDNNQIAYIVP
jgi:hypothetical protein